MPDLTQNRFLVVFWGGYVCNFNMLRSTHVFVILLLVNNSWLCLHLWARVNMHGHGNMPVVSTWTFFFCVCCILAYTPHTDAFTYTKYSFDPLLLFKHHSTYCMNCVHVCHECSSPNDNVAKSALSLQELAQNEGAFVFLQYIFTCVCHSFCLLSSWE